jgi:cytochrome c oxidase assembly protein subunit 15
VLHSVAGVLGKPVVLSRLALASVVANVVIVGTGGAVRLTGSGLGCPTWPECTGSSYRPTPQLGIYGVIEFGNRMLTFVVGLIAAVGLVAAIVQRRRVPGALRPAILVLASIPAQAVVGGATVLTDLNPWVVACHFLVSMGVIAAAYVFWRRTTTTTATATTATTTTATATAMATPEPSPTPEPTPTARHTAVSAPLRHLSAVITVVAGGVLIAGAIVTGSGPHAGDAHARRTGLDPAAVAQLHADLVFLLIGLSVAAWFALRAGGARAAARLAAVLVTVELAQGLIGFVQYFTHLPIVLVGLHMLGASLVWLAAVALLMATAVREEYASVAVPAQPQAFATAAGR